MICPRCQGEFTGRKDKIYCTEKCRKKEELRRWDRRGAPARAASQAAYLAEHEPIWAELRAKKAEARQARLAMRKPKVKVVKKVRPTFLQRLENYSPEPNTGCWLWLGRLSKKGYAEIFVDGKRRNACRVAYAEWVSTIPEGKMICHHCDNPACVNPDHLYAGTAQSNHDDMVRRGRRRVNVAGLLAHNEAKKKPKLSAWGRKRYAGMGI
jgi:hypothetical protein